MRSTFFGLNIARRALQTQQRALDVMGHNIANANTPGYSRQVAVQTTSEPYTLPSRLMPTTAGQVGTGVTIAAITRMRDDFIEMQLRNETESAGRWNARQHALHQVELLLMEPSDYSLRDAMDRFWESLQVLHTNPESDAARSVVRERALSLTASFQHLDKQLTDLREDLDRLVAMDVGKINNLTAQLADVNHQIHRIHISGQQPNDLLDRRDALLLELSELTDIDLVVMDDGTASVNISGLTVVNGNHATELRTEVSNPDPNNPPPISLVKVMWGDSDREVRPGNGHLAGVLEARDELIPSYWQSLDELASTLIAEFNAVHRSGYTLGDHLAGAAPDGGDFFTGTGVNDIDVHGDILTNLNNIAASADGTTGDGSNVLALSRLYNDTSLMGGGTISMADHFNGLVAGVGVASQKAKSMSASQEVLVDHLETRRDSISGVSLDEEMVDMIRFQQAYNAAARLVTAMDEVLETIISRMGVVGR